MSEINYPQDGQYLVKICNRKEGCENQCMHLRDGGECIQKVNDTFELYPQLNLLLFNSSAPTFTRDAIIYA